MASSDQVASARMAQMQMPMITQPAQMTMTRELMPTDTYRASDQLPISNMYMYRSDLLPNLGPAMINVEGEEVGCCCTKSTETVTFYASVVTITQHKQYFCPPRYSTPRASRTSPSQRSAFAPWPRDTTSTIRAAASSLAVVCSLQVL